MRQWACFVERIEINAFLLLSMSVSHSVIWADISHFFHLNFRPVIGGDEDLNQSQTSCLDDRDKDHNSWPLYQRRVQ